MKNRREFIKILGLGSVATLVLPDLLLDQAAGSSPAHALADAWAQVPGILKRIKPPVFPKRDFVITKYGAVADGKTECTEAFRRAIAACNKAGGGRVVVPAGSFLTGAIHLKSNVNLHVSAGATIKFSRDASKYLPVVFSRWEGVELMNYSPFIYAFEQENIAITGEGTLDGQADKESWWPWNGNSRPEYGWKTGSPNQRNDRKT